MLLIALALIVAAAGIGAWVYYDKVRGGQAAAQPQGKPGKGRGGKGGDGGPIPVVAGVAQVGEIPIYLERPGHGDAAAHGHRAQPRRRRAGARALRRRAVVKEGELLAEIDPRPFQVQLDAGGGPARQGPGAARERAHRPRALPARSSSRTRSPSSRSTPRPRWCASTKARSQSTRRRSTTRGCSSPMRASPRRSAGGSACARSIPATSCTPATPTASSSSPQLAADHAWSSRVPQDSLPAVHASACSAASKLAVEAWDREQKAQARRRHARSRSTTRSIRTTGTVKLKAQFANADERAVPEPVRQRAHAARHAARTWSSCPSAAVQRGAPGTFVYVVRPTTRSRCAPVKLGPTDGAAPAIAEGLDAGRAGRDRRHRPAARRRAGRGRRGAAARSSAPAGPPQARRGRPPARKERRDEPVAPLHPAAGGDLAADGGDPARRASSPTASCRSRRCRRSTTRRSRCRPSIRAPARR